MSQPLSASGIRREAREVLKEIGKTEILIGIPSFNNQETIQYVVESVARGVQLHYPDKKALVMVSDGGSLDDTRERATDAVIPPDVLKLVTIYRGLAGKGSAFRAIFEAGSYLDVDYCLVVDSDLRSDLPAWVKRHIDPLITEDMDLLTPNYARHKHDGTITNNVCFPMTSSLYGLGVRQPIGGDFALSGDLVQHYSLQSEWDTDVARFGIDIWMTTLAICEDFRVGQTNLGAKIHDPKDPGESLGPMFRQVVGTLFRLMGRYHDRWRKVEKIEAPPTFGPPLDVEPEPVEVNRHGLRKRAFDGWRYHAGEYSEYLPEATLGAVADRLETSAPENIELPCELWSHVLFDFAIAYNQNPDERSGILNALVPLYFARTATLFDEMEDMGDNQADDYIRSLASVFQDEKSYLIGRWKETTR